MKMKIDKSQNAETKWLEDYTSVSVVAITKLEIYYCSALATAPAETSVVAKVAIKIKTSFSH